MLIETDDDALVLICAFRYALGRRTYVVPVVAGWIRANWGKLGEGDKALIKMEIDEAISKDLAGDQCDINEWLRVLWEK